MTPVVARGVLRFALCAASAVLLGSCGGDRAPAAAHVPAGWREVRASAGHERHLGKVACRECHGDGFSPPPLEVCARCHVKTSWLHHTDPTLQTPVCGDCHNFGRTVANTPWGCLRCHAQDQGRVLAIGAHADQPCSGCHQPHRWPGTSRRECAECHPDRQTQHAGLRGCRDCHAVHEVTRSTLASIDPKHLPAGPGALCERCHARQRGRLHADTQALTPGHVDCTSCHAPHSKQGFAARACTDCHKDQPVLAAARHPCTGCHAPHDGGAAKPCVTCHHEPVAHPAPTRSPLGSCAGCHPPHDRVLAMASASAPRGPIGLACTSCHAQPSHATARCLDCHAPHGGKPTLATELCATCHAAQVKTTSLTGHARCSTCHTSNIHGPQARPPACTTCHASEAASASPGHASCSLCHQPHAPRPVATCATCHAQPAARGHGTHVACSSCHRAHGPAGPATPPACLTCHQRARLPGLHQSPRHADCATCHRAHELRPSDDRPACTSSCHKDRKNHEPTATRCATCHPFK